MLGEIPSISGFMCSVTALPIGPSLPISTTGIAADIVMAV